MTLYTMIEALVGIVLGLVIAIRTKKVENLVYGKLDKAGRITNILLLLLYVCLSPLFLLLGALSHAGYGGFLGVIGWIVAIITASAVLPCGVGLGLSVAWRKQGKSKASFAIQFAGLAGMMQTMLFFLLFYGNLLDSLN